MILIPFRFAVAAIGIAVALVIAAGPLFAQAESPSAAAYKTALAEFEKASKQYKEDLSAAKTPEAEKAVRDKWQKTRGNFLGQCMAIVQTQPNDPVAADALIQVVGLGSGMPLHGPAIAMLAKDHAKDKKIGGVCLGLVFAKPPEAETLLRAVLEKNPDHNAQGLACLALAMRLQERSKEETSKEKADKEAAEAAKLFEQVGEKFDDVSDEHLGKLGEVAKAALFEIRNLAVGKTAPDIEGEDIDGKKFKLSDYRGKVVVLEFWGNWCPDCRGMYPALKSLSKRMENKPFALVGVNSDANREEIKKVIEEKQLAGRCFFDGGSRRGPIASAWNVLGWPTIYVIDQKGVIRNKGHEELKEKLDKIVDTLAQEGTTEEKPK
jgi:peroxiredoxin